MDSRWATHDETPTDNNHREIIEFTETNLEIRTIRPKFPTVSIIIPVKNAEKFLDECFRSILTQTYEGTIEVSIFNDHSEDKSPQIIEEWCNIFSAHNIKHVFTTSKEDVNDKMKTGCGFAKNRAIEQSTGEYLCFLDADDIMFERRIELQLLAALKNPGCIIGSNFVREPRDATTRFTNWCNSLTQEELIKQQFRECTIIQPTWFMHRDIYNKVGGYQESGPNTPEDLIFFHHHLSLNGGLYKVDEPLLVYRYHPEATSHGIHRLKLLEVKIRALEERVLSKWPSFSIWGAGRDGRKFFGELSHENKLKVVSLCDVDVKKIGTIYHQPYTNLKVPIIHFSQVKPPFIICVALDRTEGEFEQNVKSLGLVEGVDYYHFN